MMMVMIMENECERGIVWGDQLDRVGKSKGY
jgi:hypothetical protein